MKKLTDLASELTGSVMWKLADFTSSMGSGSFARRERLYAERESAVMLEWYERVRAADAQLSGKKLYEKIVADRRGCDPREAREIVRHAEDSYALWPDDRDLTFRDVVHYVIVHDLLAAHPDSLGTRANTEHAVKNSIPGEL